MARDMNWNAVYILILMCSSSVSSVNDKIDIFDADVPEGIDVTSYAREENLKRPLSVSESQRSAYGKNSKSITKGYHLLERGKPVPIPPSSSSNHLQVFCYEGEVKRLASLFRSAEVNLAINSSNFRHYEAKNVSEVKKLYAETSWFSFYPWRPTVFSLEVYEHSCLGLETAEGYIVSLRIKSIDVWRVGVLLCGALLFLSAPSLARNLLFHYFTGGLLGVVGSFLILVFLLSKFLPKRSGAVVFLLGGSGVMIYALQFFYSNFVTIISEYYFLFVGYLVVTILLSFAAIYRWGPISDHRSLQLVQWSLQAIALLAVFFSCQLREVTAALIVVLLAYSNSPAIVSKMFSRLWVRMYPPKPKLLSEEEYIKQGQVATALALEELRNYCKSPQCNAWKTFSRLGTPKRFAEFVEGSPHVPQEESFLYEHTVYSGQGFTLPLDDDAFTDDESDS